jgi:DNA-binding response OmpR family regulator
MKVLLVEQDSELRQTVYETLKSTEMDIEMVATPSAAIGKLTGGRSIILATSWTNQDLVTTELLQQLISDRIVNAYVILLLKANASTEDVMKGLQAGADDFVFQPQNRAELIMRFGVAERIMSLKSMHSDISPAPVTAPNFTKRKPLVNSPRR